MVARWPEGTLATRRSFEMLGKTAPKLSRISKLSKLQCTAIAVVVVALCGAGVCMGLFGPPFLEERLAGPQSQGIRLTNSSVVCTTFPNGTALPQPVPNCWSRECGESWARSEKFAPATPGPRPTLRRPLVLPQTCTRLFRFGTSSLSWR